MLPKARHDKRDVVVAILAKDKEHCLPRYLKCLEEQTWPKSRTHVYVRTNNNNDKTSEMLQAWVDVQKKKTKKEGKKKGDEEDGYASIFIDTSNVDVNVQQWTPHEWNGTRFKVLAAIRQASIVHAEKLDAHYFVADVDNFIAPYTLENMYDSGYDAIAPLLVNHGTYANCHFRTDSQGYLETKDHSYDNALSRLELRGVIECQVIHCTYFLSRSILPFVVYDDGSKRHEYVIMAHQLRNAKVPQYIDNRVDYGRVSFADDLATLEKEPWIGLFPPPPPPPSSSSSSSSSSYTPPLQSSQSALGSDLVPSGLMITYGGEHTLRRNVTRECCDKFLSEPFVLVIPANCDFNSFFGDTRFWYVKALRVFINGIEIASVDEYPKSPVTIPLRFPSSSSSSSSDSTSFLASHHKPLPSSPSTLSSLAFSPPTLKEEEEKTVPKKAVAAVSPKKESLLTEKEEDDILSKKWLIISPQAGFGNRLRAMCSGILLAHQLGRTPIHAWTPEVEGDVRSNNNVIAEHLVQTRSHGWSDYFVSNKIKLPSLMDAGFLNVLAKTTAPKSPLKCYTEWMPGDNWYAHQSRTQRLLENHGIALERIRIDANMTPLQQNSDDTFLVLETSHSVRLFSSTTDEDKKEKKKEEEEDEKRKKTEAEYEKKLSAIYAEYFVPLQEFQKKVEPIGTVPVGISVRRGEFLHYFRDANVSRDTLLSVLDSLIDKNSYVLFSDDYEFRDALVRDLGSLKKKPLYSVPTVVTMSIPQQWKRAFVEFLILAFKCERVYGTSLSSFAKEAAIFGSKPYSSF